MVCIYADDQSDRGFNLADPHSANPIMSHHEPSWAIMSHHEPSWASEREENRGNLRRQETEPTQPRKIDHYWQIREQNRRDVGIRSACSIILGDGWQL